MDLKVDGTHSVKKLVPKNMIVVDRNDYHTDKISMMYPIEKNSFHQQSINTNENLGNEQNLIRSAHMAPEQVVVCQM